MGLFDNTAATQYNQVNPVNRRLVYLLPLSLAFVWSMYIFGPSSATISSNVPRVSVKYHPNRPPPSPFNETKVALLIENRPLGHLAPLLLHMITVVPPDWRFIFLGSEVSVNHVNSSLPVQQHEKNGKLDLKMLPENSTVTGQEEMSQLLTDMWFYDNMVGSAEWLLVFQSDSIMCANSEMSLNGWLEYDWVGAPWSINDRFGGNGGLSLRRVSAIRKVLQFQTRIPDTQPEDLWFIDRIGLLPGAKMANGTQEAEFSVENVWHPHPMGYHLGWTGNSLPEGVWEDETQRKKVYEYCPEIKLILNMKLEREKCEPEDYEKMKKLEEEEEEQEQEEEDKQKDDSPQDDGGSPQARQMDKRETVRKYPVMMW